MKKIFFGILILFGIIFKVDAKEVYYSEYGDFSNYTLEAIESSELINVEVERRYRFYREEKVGEYRSFLDDNSNFQFVDLNDKKDSEFSSWNSLKPSDGENRIIESKTFYKIKKPKKINRISFMNTLTGSLKLNEIEVYYLEEKIDYDLIFDNSDVNFNIYPLGTLTLDLKDYYDLQKLTVKVKSIDFKDVPEIIVLASIPSANGMYDINYFSYNLMSSNNENVVIEASDWIRGNVEYEEEILTDSKPTNESLSIVNEATLYRYQDPLFYFYNVERKYAEGYFKDNSNLTKDELDYKDYYRYQIRDKFEIEDEIIITDYKQKLSDFVSSTVDYEVITNLDMITNGIYQVEFKTPFVNIKKDVLLKIKDNELSDSEVFEDKINLDFEKLKEEKNKLLSELDSLKEEYGKLNFEFENIKSKYEELNSDSKNSYNNLNSILNYTNNKYDNLLKDYQHLQKKYQDINNQELEINDCKVKLEEALIKIDDSNKKLELSKQANNYLKSNLLNANNRSSSIKKSDLFWFGLVPIILIILLLIVLKKMSNKNKF